MSDTIVELSRLQFAITALYHFLFVPLTIGLSILLVIMETVYVMTGRAIWKDMVKFWGVLFGINFAMGVATGITMEFQFGTNWAYFSHYIGDVFGAALAIEGMMAFFLEATFVGLFFFGWDRLSKVGHLIVTCLVALGSNFSALWILIANGWMQNPVGAAFNPETMRMEVTDFYAIIFNDVAQAKFVHTISAGYVTGSIFVLAVSAFYFLQGRHREFAKRSMTVAASFGLASALSVVVLGDESGYAATEHQKMKLAAIEAEWETHPPPAGFNLIAWPDVERRENSFEVKIPWLLGLIATRSINTEVLGIKDLVEKTKGHVKRGLRAYKALQILRQDKTNKAALAIMEIDGKFLGYALLLKKRMKEIKNVTPKDIELAAWDTVPNVLVLFWSFRIMVGLGMFFILLFGVGFVLSARRSFEKNRWYLWIALLSLPFPWIASELGWIVAEYGRQPWVIEGILPTFLGVSNVSVGQLTFSITGFVIFYSALAVVDLYLIIKYIRRGPDAYLGHNTDDQIAARPLHVMP